MASERDASVDRIIAFSDGVVAIAITLLISRSPTSNRLRAPAWRTLPQTTQAHCLGSLFSPSAGLWALLLLFPAQIIASRLTA